MISVLIPTYNYNIFPLVQKVHTLLEKEKIPFEVICLDDASDNDSFITENKNINQLKNASYHILEKNIGRSKIRNLLGKKATYPWLLFLDADVIPIQDDFIKQYIKYINHEPSVIYGGIRYQSDKPSNKQLLRWQYGKKREALTAQKRKEKPYISFLTLNFMIHKEILSKVPFNESIPNLRHEDTLFSFDLKNKNVPIYHIENPVYHLGIESSRIFLEKSIDSLKPSIFFEQQKLVPNHYIKLNRYYDFFKKMRLLFLIDFFGKLFEKKIEHNLLSDSPSLLFFDLYRLYHFRKLKRHKVISI